MSAYGVSLIQTLLSLCRILSLPDHSLQGYAFGPVAVFPALRDSARRNLDDYLAGFEACSLRPEDIETGISVFHEERTCLASHQTNKRAPGKIRVIPKVLAKHQ